LQGYSACACNPPSCDQLGKGSRCIDLPAEDQPAKLKATCGCYADDGVTAKNWCKKDELCCGDREDCFQGECRPILNCSQPPTEAGCECFVDSQCGSGKCLAGADGGLQCGCAQDGDCQAFLICDKSGSDLVGRCSSVYPAACAPCDSDGDCQGDLRFTISCIPFRNGNFCAGSCVLLEGTLSCPSGYQCITDLTGAQASVCLPGPETENKCPCTGPARDKGTPNLYQCVDWYRDHDRDGWATDEKRCLCKDNKDNGDFTGTVDKRGDCDDTKDDIHPGAPEICDGIDNDCNGSTDSRDADAIDAQGYLKAGDAPDCAKNLGVCSGAKPRADRCFMGTWQPCVDGDYLAHDSSYEAGTEATCDGLDNDCDGRIDEDFQVDDWNGLPRTKGQPCGTGACANGTVRCTVDKLGVECSTDSLRTDEKCNYVDDNCDGTTDEGYSYNVTSVGGRCWGTGGCQQRLGTVECNAAMTGAVCSTNPGGSENLAVVEACNGVDDDCDGSTDEGLGIGSPDCPCLKVGVCSPQLVGASCVQGNWVCNYDRIPTYEAGVETLCDNLDNDCDGLTDEGITRPCYSGNPSTKGVGECHGGTQTCNKGVWLSACAGEVIPALSDKCDGKDEDCDGTTDPEGAEGCTLYYRDMDGDHVGTGPARCLCSPDPIQGYVALVSGDCDDTDSRVFPSHVEGTTLVPGGSVCGKDGDCDGSLLDVGESCDDGNSVPLDGCNSCLIGEFRVASAQSGGQVRQVQVVTQDTGGYSVAWSTDTNTAGLFDASAFGSDGGLDSAIPTVSHTGLTYSRWSIAPRSDGALLAFQLICAPQTYPACVPDSDFLRTNVVSDGVFLAGGWSSSANHYSPAHSLGPMGASRLPEDRYVATLQTTTSPAVNHFQFFDNVGQSSQGPVEVSSSEPRIFLHMATQGSSAFVVLWTDTLGQSLYIDRYSSQSSNLGAGIPPENQVNVQDASGYLNANAQMAIPSDQSIAIAWNRQIATAPQSGQPDATVMFRKFGVDGTPQGDALTLVTAEGVTLLPHLRAMTVLSSKRLALVVARNSAYGDANSRPSEVFLFNPDGSLVSQAFSLTQQGRSNCDKEAIAPLPDGGFVVAWQCDGDGIFAQRFDSNGIRVLH